MDPSYLMEVGGSVRLNTGELWMSDAEALSHQQLLRDQIKRLQRMEQSLQFLEKGPRKEKSTPAKGGAMYSDSSPKAGEKRKEGWDTPTAKTPGKAGLSKPAKPSAPLRRRTAPQGGTSGMDPQGVSHPPMIGTLSWDGCRVLRASSFRGFLSSWDRLPPLGGQ